MWFKNDYIVNSHVWVSLELFIVSNCALILTSKSWCKSFKMNRAVDIHNSLHIQKKRALSSVGRFYIRDLIHLVIITLNLFCKFAIEMWLTIIFTLKRKNRIQILQFHVFDCVYVTSDNVMTIIRCVLKFPIYYMNDTENEHSVSRVSRCVCVAHDDISSLVSSHILLMREQKKIESIYKFSAHTRLNHYYLSFCNKKNLYIILFLRF